MKTGNRGIFIFFAALFVGLLIFTQIIDGGETAAPMTAEEELEGRVAQSVRAERERREENAATICAQVPDAC